MSRDYRSTKGAVLKPIWRWATALAVGTAVIIQLVPVGRSNPPLGGEILAPPDVHGMLRRACYDCHSNETNWPWYSYVAPISWLVVGHVKEGRQHLNFSTWNEYDMGQIERKLEEISEEVEEGAMPLGQYLWLHPDARLSEQDREALRIWATGG